MLEAIVWLEGQQICPPADPTVISGKGTFTRDMVAQFEPPCH